MGTNSLKGHDFINDEEILNLLESSKNPEKAEIREIFAKSKAKTRLEPEETAKLLQIEDPDLLEEMFALARQIKEEIYGNRIVFLHHYISGTNEQLFILRV